ncbi:MAG: TPM domain-containing protein [Steroidobacteraceae bacterium]
MLPSLLTAMAFAPVARAQTELQAIPALTARVTDQADVLSAQQEAELEALLTSFETRKGAQIAVLTVATVAPEEIEQYSIRVVDAWKLGRQGVDDGALLLVAVDDRRVRIEVGRGLEGALTDLVSNRIIDEAIVPAFRAGDYPGGIAQGVERMIRKIRCETRVGVNTDQCSGQFIFFLCPAAPAHPRDDPTATRYPEP